MADESTDISTKKELSVCGRWLEDGTVVGHFLCVIHIKEATAEALSQYLIFLEITTFPYKACVVWGLMAQTQCLGREVGYRSCEIACSKCSVCSLSLSSAPVSSHSYCKRSQKKKKFFGTLLTIWKVFHYSPKQIEKLIDLEAELGVPELKIGKPSDTRWLARESCVRAVRRVLPALIEAFEEIYAESGDAEAFGL